MVERVSGDTGLSQAEPEEVSALSGFDPSRDETLCPYRLTDPRATVWLDGYSAALRWMREATR